MTRPTERDLDRRVADLEGGGELTDELVEDAYALLVGMASGGPTPAERKRWRQLPADVRETVTEGLDAGDSE